MGLKNRSGGYWYEYTVPDLHGSGAFKDFGGLTFDCVTEDTFDGQKENPMRSKTLPQNI